MLEFLDYLRNNFFSQFNKKQAIDRLRDLEEIDYGDEEILGSDFKIFNDVIVFFYELKDEFGSIKNFFYSIIDESKNSREVNDKITENIKHLSYTSTKFADFKQLCDQIHNKQNTLNNSIKSIIEGSEIVVCKETFTYK